MKTIPLDKLMIETGTSSAVRNTSLTVFWHSLLHLTVRCSLVRNSAISRGFQLCCNKVAIQEERKVARGTYDKRALRTMPYYVGTTDPAMLLS